MAEDANSVEGPSALAVFEEIRVGALPTIGIADASVTETDSGTTDMKFSLTLSAALEAPATVELTTRQNSKESAALPDEDYLPISSQKVEIPAGALNATAIVKVVGDTKVEPTEKLFVDVTNAAGAVRIRRPEGIGTIFDNDNLPAIAQEAKKEDFGPGNASDQQKEAAAGPNTTVGTGQAPSPANQPSVQPQPPQAPQPLQPQVELVAQAQAQANSQVSVQSQAGIATQTQPALMLERQREIQVQAEHADPGKPNTLLASALQSTPGTWLTIALGALALLPKVSRSAKSRPAPAKLARVESRGPTLHSRSKPRRRRRH